MAALASRSDRPTWVDNGSRIEHIRHPYFRQSPDDIFAALISPRVSRLPVGYSRPGGSVIFGS